jgi:hypothetical protein
LGEKAFNVHKFGSLNFLRVLKLGLASKRSKAQDSDSDFEDYDDDDMDNDNLSVSKDFLTIVAGI